MHVCPRQCLGIGVGLKDVMSKTGTSKSLLVYLRCHGGDSLIRVDQNGIEGEGSCKFGKIEQSGPHAFLIYTYCDDDTNGSTRFEIIDGKLVITALES
jgi:hypothetical protein